jgi:class 3 adenylate cyclase
LEVPKGLIRDGHHAGFNRMRASERISAATERLFAVGHDTNDSLRSRRAKSVFAAVLLVFVIFTIVEAVEPDRSIIVRCVDGVSVLACLFGIAALYLTQSLPIAFAIVMGSGVLVQAAYYAINGNRDGDFYVFLLIPAAAISLLGPSKSVYYLIIVLTAASAILMVDPFLPGLQSSWNETPTNPKGWLFHSPDKFRLRQHEAESFFAITILVYALLYSSAVALREANARTEALLLNVLPRSIASRLMDDDKTKLDRSIADRFDDVTVLFADLVGFTDLSRRIGSDELVRVLNRLFSEFDRIASRHDVEKIKTIGDAYMAACGLPEPNTNHAENIAKAAFEMLQAVNSFNEDSGYRLELRIGINTGEVVAGVIGEQRLLYDLWGEAVNIASRMESTSKPGIIQTTEATMVLLRNQFEFASLGEIDVKGQGRIATWQLVGRKTGSEPA